MARRPGQSRACRGTGGLSTRFARAGAIGVLILVALVGCANTARRAPTIAESGGWRGFAVVENRTLETYALGVIARLTRGRPSAAEPFTIRIVEAPVVNATVNQGREIAISAKR